MPTTTYLDCACCGGGAGRWQQWHNRDAGYGVCRRCADWMLDELAQSRIEFRQCYGVPGVHYQPAYFSTMGRQFVILAEFPDTDDGARAANAYMEAFPGAAVLAVTGGRIVLADKGDTGMPMPVGEV